MPGVTNPFEQFHAQWLANYAVREADAGGRRFAEPEHPYRTCFQRDRDRIVHCSAYRRLDFKTQVFTPHVQDHYRTRLTHTVEVAQVGRSLARALRLNEDAVEAVALAHDLGHPPFGHAGEAVLNDLMADHGHFEHNRQSLRVVDYLEHPYPAFRGLNLTYVVRECLAKHQTRYDTPLVEAADIDTTQHAPLEGQLVDLADEIAYTAADLEDALNVGWLTVESLAGLALWQQAWATAEREFPDARPIHKQIRAVKAVLATLADDAVQTTLTHIQTMGLDSPHAVRSAPRRAATFSPAVKDATNDMAKFLLKNVYTHGANKEKEHTARRIITGLFERFTQNPATLPPRYQQRIETQGLHRVVCDYIAGMTDRFARETFEKFA